MKIGYQGVEGSNSEVAAKRIADKFKFEDEIISEIKELKENISILENELENVQEDIRSIEHRIEEGKEEAEDLDEIKYLESVEVKNLINGIEEFNERRFILENLYRLPRTRYFDIYVEGEKETEGYSVFKRVTEQELRDFDGDLENIKEDIVKKAIDHGKLEPEEKNYVKEITEIDWEEFYDSEGFW